eukprot:752897-Hanusia_phi.AAC.1
MMMMMTATTMMIHPREESDDVSGDEYDDISRVGACWNLGYGWSSLSHQQDFPAGTLQDCLQGKEGHRLVTLKWKGMNNKSVRSRQLEAFWS